MLNVQEVVFYNVIAFNQNISSWDVSDGEKFVSIATNVSITFYAESIPVANRLSSYIHISKYIILFSKTQQHLVTIFEAGTKVLLLQALISAVDLIVVVIVSSVIWLMFWAKLCSC